MANVMQQVRATNHVNRNGFDLSKKVATTAKVGELNVLYSRLCMKGDKFNINKKHLTRTMPINTSAYTRIREYFDWYFVPLNLLWNRFNVWSTNMKEQNMQPTSINGTNALTDKHPYFTTDQISDYLSRVQALGPYQDAPNLDRGYTNELGFERHTLTKKLLHSLGYGDFYTSERPLYNVEMSPWKLLAYQKIYQDFYRNSQWEKPRPETYSINYIDGSEGTLNIPVEDIDVERYSMFDVRYANWNKDLFMGLLPDSQYGDAASVNTSIPSFNIDLRSPEIDSYYSQYLRFNDNTNTRQDTSVLYMRGLSEGSSNSGYVYGAGGNQGDPTGNLQFMMSPAQLQQLRYNLGLNGEVKTINSLQSSFTILALRQAEALQKWKEISGSNPYDFKSQAEAHFGVKLSSAYSDRCQYLGGQDSNIDISEVLNTNITDGNAADIAGKGVGTGSGSISFDTEVDGVLMCIYHARPLLDYAINGISPDNTKTLFTDYAIPEFDQTGMVAVPLVHLTNEMPGLGISGTPLLGYAPRYWDYKTDIDEIRGAFYNGDLDFKTWVAPINNEYIERWMKANAGLVFDGLDSAWMKINPSTLNPIFTAEADSSVNTDQLLINCYFDIKAVRPLDRNGLPY